MAQYVVNVFCDECSVPHPMRISIELDDGPAEEKSIGDTYTGRDLPPQVAKLINNRTVCPKTKELITQRDNNQIFLVPVGKRRI